MACRKSVDYIRVLDSAKAFADMYGDCKINPEIPFDAVEGRRKIYPNLPEDSYRNPDLTTIFGYVDVKSPKKQMNSCGLANDASDKQKSYVCITDHRTKISEKQIQDRTNDIWNSKLYHHDIVFWFVKGELIKYKRP